MDAPADPESQGPRGPRRRNLVLCCAGDALIVGGSVLGSGFIFQEFAVKVGLSNARIGWIGGLATIAFAVGLLACSGVGDAVRRPIRWFALAALGYAVPAGLMLAAWAAPGWLAPGPVLALALAGAFVLNALLGLQAVMSAPMVVRIFLPADVPVLHSVSGAVVAVSGMALGAAAGMVIGRWGYPLGYVACFVAAIAMVGVGGACYGALRVLPGRAREPAACAQPPWRALGYVLHLPEFRWLGPASVVRGLAGGVPYFLVPVALRQVTAAPDGYSGRLATAAALGALVSAGLLGWLWPRLGAARVYLLAGVTAGIALPALALTRGPWSFLAVFVVLQIAINLENYGVPLGVYEVVRPEALGAYNGIRLFVLSLASTIAILAAGPLLDHLPVWPVLLAGGLLKLAMGVVYAYGDVHARALRLAGAPRPAPAGPGESTAVA